MQNLIPSRFADITPSDTEKISGAGLLGLYIGAAGVLKAKGTNGGTATFEVQAGQILPGSFSQVLDTGTTATGIVGLYGQ